jgi:DnaK suppressor protein
MTESERAELKARMQEELTALREVVDSLEESDEPVSPDVAIGRLSRLDTMINQGVNKASIGKARRRIHKLEEALKHVGKPDFGECCECGEPIAMARLLALPESEYCIECAE